MKLTDKGRKILKYMAGNGTAFHQPTKIGEACGSAYYSSSAWASSGLKTLEKAGLVSRNNKGHWALTPSGLTAVETL